MSVPKEKLNAVFYNGLCVPRWYVGDKAEWRGAGGGVTTCICPLLCVCFLVTNLSLFMGITRRQENMCENECTFP